MRAAGTRKANRARSPAVPTVAPVPMPHGRWLRCLLLQGHANGAIRTLLANDDLPPSSDAALNVLRSSLIPPKGFQPTSTTHTASVEYVRQLGLEPVFRQTPEMQQALVLLRTPRARELVESAMLIGVPGPAIVQVLATHLRMNITVAALEMYAATFFDTATLTRAQLRLVVQARVRQSVVRVAGGDEDGPAARRAIAADGRMLAVSMSKSPLGLDVLLLAAGLSPGRRELSRALVELENVTTTCVASALLRGGRDDDKRALGFTNVLRGLREIHTGASSPQDELAAKMRQFRLKTETQKMPSVADLQARGDDVTTDVVPAIDPRTDMSGPRDDEREIPEDAAGEL
jgi:hypothetical protein